MIKTHSLFNVLVQVMSSGLILGAALGYLCVDIWFRNPDYKLHFMFLIVASINLLSTFLVLLDWNIQVLALRQIILRLEKRIKDVYPTNQ